MLDFDDREFLRRKIIMFVLPENISTRWVIDVAKKKEVLSELFSLLLPAVDFSDLFIFRFAEASKRIYYIVNTIQIKTNTTEFCIENMK